MTSATTATTSTVAAERRQSLVMSSGPRVTSPRHHPYMSPGKVYTPSIMSTLQSYRQSSGEYKQQQHNDNDLVVGNNAGSAAATNYLNRHPW